LPFARGTEVARRRNGRLRHRLLDGVESVEPLARAVADYSWVEVDAETAVVALDLSAEPTGGVAGRPGRRCRLALSRSGNC
jgi:hypothetical protein